MDTHGYADGWHVFQIIMRERFDTITNLPNETRQFVFYGSSNASKVGSPTNPTQAIMALYMLSLLEAPPISLGHMALGMLPLFGSYANPSLG